MRLRLPACLVLIVLLLVVAGCSGKRGTSAIGDLGEFTQQGLASWYGKPFHGRRTASGERYDMYKMTAAHRTLPFGVVVEVTNLDNGRSVQVRITDRGPFRKGRIIDLSYAAAKKLQMVQPGVVPVRVAVVRR